LDPLWPARPSSQDSIYGAHSVRAALDRIAADLTAPTTNWPGTRWHGENLIASASSVRHPVVD